MKAITIAHVFPDLLNLYGDGGNVCCLQKRCAWRDLPVEVVPVLCGQEYDFAQADIVFLGGGPDREQQLAAEQLFTMRDSLKAYVENGGVLLAVCGGFQLLGKEWLLGSQSIKGLGIVDMRTQGIKGGEEAQMPKSGADRLVDDVVLDSVLSDQPVVGYENHAGRTFLGEGLRPFGRVISSSGHGNNDTEKQDGVIYKHVLGTYLHGPLLAKNPQIADTLLRWAADVRLAKDEEGFTLKPLDDAIEQAANEYMIRRLGLR